MKRSLFVALTALLLPVCSAWAFSTTYYSKLTINKAGTGAGKIYAANASTSNPAYQSDSMSSTASGTSKSQKYYIYAEAPAGTKFKGWTASGATLGSTTALSTTATINATSTKSGTPTTATVTANFEEITYSSFSVTFAKPENGSISVDGTTVGDSGLVKGPYTQVYNAALTATAASGYAFDGWYATPAGGTQTLLSRSSNYTAAFETTTSVTAKFVSVVTAETYEALANSLKNNTCTEIPAGKTIDIPSGTTLTVDSGKQLVVNGTLWVVGTLSNSGVIGGSGAIAALKYTVTQTGNADGAPIATETTLASYQKKYYQAAVSQVASSINGTTPNCTILYGARVMRNNAEIARGTWPSNETPGALACSINSSVAVNHITGFLSPAYYTDVAKGMAAVQNKATTQMLVLLSDYTVSQNAASEAGILNTDAKLNGNFGTMDLAGKTLTINTSKINSYSHILLNGSLSEKALLYSGAITCINLSSVSFSSVAPKYASNINLYDCKITAKIPSKYDTSASGSSSASVNFYSSSTSSYATSYFQTDTSHYHIYGGTWTSKPADSYIASALASEYAFYQTTEGATTYSLQPKANREVVTFGGDDKYESFDDAIATLETKFASADSVKMTMVKNATLAKPITIPTGKTLEIELAGCAITAATGFAINHGTLILGDEKANLSSTGGRIVTSSGNFITNDGTVDITYGYYTGNMALNGGMFTTHHGYFTGSFSGDKQYADLRGGYFAQDVSSILQDGYYRTSGYVGPFPMPVVTKTWNTSGYWQVTMKTLSDSDLSLYNNTANLKSSYTLANWKRRAEVQSMLIPWVNHMVDIVVGFDRDVAKGSATAKVTDPMSLSRDLDKNVAANEIYRVLSPYMTSTGAYQVKYTRFLSEKTFQTTSFGIVSSVAGNKGTTANLRVELCTGSDESPRTLYALMSEYTVIGAGKTNEAMIQPASGAATFYATLAEAINAAQAGDTIKLCNDVTSTDTITVSKACTIDTNGMVFKGSIAAGQGYAVSSVSTVSDVEKMLGKVRVKYLVFAKGGSDVIKTGESEYSVVVAPETSSSDDAATTAVAVPFKGKSVATLLDTTLLNDDDTLMAWIKVDETSGYATWKLTGGVWVGQDVVNGIAAQPATTALKCGQAVWVTTKGSIVINGDMNATGDTVEVTVGHNLLGNTKLVEATPEVGEEGDQVQLIGEENISRYNKTATGWESKVQTITTLPNGKRVVTETTSTEVPKVKPGKGYWMIKK